MKIALDKKKHLIAGLLVGVAAVFVMTKYGFATKEQRIFVASMAAFLVGVGKEIKDKFTPGSTVDVMDAVYTGGGGVVGSVAATFLSPFLNN